MRRLLLALALSLAVAPAFAQRSAAKGSAPAPEAGMVITGDKEAPLVLYIVPWQEPASAAPPAVDVLPLLPQVLDDLRSVADRPADADRPIK